MRPGGVCAALEGSKEGPTSKVLGERIRLQTDDEVEAGRRRLACGRPVEYAAEVDAGVSVAERAAARLEAEQEAGRFTSAKRVWL